MNNKKDKGAIKIPEAALTICFFISAAATLFFVRDFYRAIALIIGEVFLLYGAKILTPKYLEKNEKIGRLIAIVIGILFIVIPIVSFNINIDWKFVCIIIFFLISTILSLLVIIPAIQLIHFKKVCTTTVLASISDFKITLIHSNVTRRYRKVNSGPSLKYYPIYSFEYENKKYEVTRTNNIKIGVRPKDTKVELKINPNNPREFLDDIDVSKKIRFSVAVGGICLTQSIPLLIYILTRIL